MGDSSLQKLTGTRLLLLRAKMFNSISLSSRPVSLHGPASRNPIQLKQDLGRLLINASFSDVCNLHTLPTAKQYQWFEVFNNNTNNKENP